MTRELSPLAAAWAARQQQDWVAHYWQAAEAPHRVVLEQAVARVAPYQVLLEIGCNAGPNLRRFAARWPKGRLIGMDVNRTALAYGRDRARAGAFSRTPVTFVWTSDFGADRLDVLMEADVIVSCYCLAYATPTQLRLLFEVLRSCPSLRALVLAEPVGNGRLVNLCESGPFGVEIAEYHHDYPVLLQEAWSGLSGRPIDRLTMPPTDDPSKNRLKEVMVVRVTP